MGVDHPEIYDVTKHFSGGKHVGRLASLVESVNQIVQDLAKVKNVPD